MRLILGAKALAQVLMFPVFVSLLAACAAAVNLSPEERGELYLPSPDALTDVDQAMERARLENRLLLVMLGANWCHDSRALAARVHQQPLQELVEQRYETVLVDVGYLESGTEVMGRFGLPVYYATPTVLIIDPNDGRLVNSADRHQWGAADSISMEDSVAYFEAMANAGSPPATVSDPQLQALMAEVDAFERRAAQKVASGYARVGPMLRAYKEGGEVPGSFEDDWTEVSDFRNGLPAIVEALRIEARERFAAGEQNIRLVYPQLAPFSWQAEGSEAGSRGD